LLCEILINFSAMKSCILTAATIFIVFHAVAQVPKSAQAAYEDAMAKCREGRLAESLGSFKKATDIYPAYYQAFLDAAEVFASLMSYNDAKFCFNKAVELRPRSCEPYIKYGKFFKDRRNRSDSALMFFEKAVKLKCDTSAILCFDMGWCYNSLKQFTKAMPYLKKAIALKNTNNIYINEMSFVFHQANMPQEGIDYFQPLYDKTRLDLYKFYVGVYHADMKQKDKALQDLAELVAIRSKLAEPLEKRIKKEIPE
jgi:tetratricopeptide (TPR) repeat protein